MTIDNRLERLTKELSSVPLPGSIVAAERRSKPLIPATLERVIKRWKYKPNKYLKDNRFLKDKYRSYRKLYHNVAEEISKDESSKVILTLENLSEQYKKFMEATRLINVSWDSKFNPLLLVSEGWSFHNFEDKKILRCYCNECHKLLSIELDSIDTIHKMIQGGFLKHSHSQECYWKKYSFPLSRDYDLNKTTMLHEYLRIERAATTCQKVVFEVYFDLPVEDIKKFFGIEDSNLMKLLLRGFEASDNEKSKDIVTCNYCLHKSQKNSLANPDYNGHFSWCRYQNRSQLAQIILETMNNEEPNNDIGDRLSRLEHILITL